MKILLSQGGMRIIARSTLRSFWEKHPDAEQALKAWYDGASRAKWSHPTDIKISSVAKEQSCKQPIAVLTWHNHTVYAVS